jgi:hypothetical protein
MLLALSSLFTTGVFTLSPCVDNFSNALLFQRILSEHQCCMAVGSDLGRESGAGLTNGEDLVSRRVCDIIILTDVSARVDGMRPAVLNQAPAGSKSGFVGHPVIRCQSIVTPCACVGEYAKLYNGSLFARTTAKRAVARGGSALVDGPVWAGMAADGCLDPGYER